MIKEGFFSTFFIVPILNLLVLLYKSFLFLRLPGAFGFAIVFLTVIIRLLLEPFFHKQLETTKKLNELKPEIDLLTKKYKNDQTKLQQEQLKLYQKAGINPALGCLLPLIQLPVFIALYQGLSLFLLNGTGEEIISQINKIVYFSFMKIQYIDPWFFGFNLALTPAKSGQFYYLLIPIITGLLQYYQTKTIMISQPVKSEKKEKDQNDDFQKALNNQMKFVFPVMIGMFSYSLPVGLSLYWNVFSLFAIINTKKLQINKTKSKSTNESK